MTSAAISDVWRHTLSRIPTAFGRLVYLASLRNTNTGTYEHFGLAQMFGGETADRALRENHAEVFAEWLCFPLQRQKADLDEYLSGLDEDPRRIIETWIRLSPYRNLVPSGAREVERKLYLADLEAMLELLRREHGAVSPDPDA